MKTRALVTAIVLIASAASAPAFASDVTDDRYSTRQRETTTGASANKSGEAAGALDEKRTSPTCCLLKGDARRSAR